MKITKGEEDRVTLAKDLTKFLVDQSDQLSTGGWQKRNLA
jgi:hypothetical protein